MPAHSRIVFFNRFYYPDQSATAQILTDIAEGLADLGWPVTVIASRKSYDRKTATLTARETINGVSVVRVGSGGVGRTSIAGKTTDFSSFYLAARSAIHDHVSDGDIAIVKTDPPLLSVALGSALRRRGAFLINWLQDIYPETAIALGLRLPAKADRRQIGKPHKDRIGSEHQHG